MKISSLTLDNIHYIELGLDIGNEIVYGVYEIIKAGKVLGTIDFKKFKKWYSFEESRPAQLGIIHALLDLMGYEIVDRIEERVELCSHKFEIFNENNKDLLLTYGSSGSMEDEKIYALSEKEIYDDNGIILKNDFFHLEDHVDIKEKMKEIAKALKRMDEIKYVDVYTTHNYKRWYIVPSLDIRYIEIAYKTDKDTEVCVENDIYFLYKINKEAVEKVGNYVDVLVKKVAAEALIQSYIDREGDENLFLEDKNIQNQIFKKLDFSPRLYSVSEFVENARNAIEEAAFLEALNKYNIK